MPGLLQFPAVIPILLLADGASIESAPSYPYEMPTSATRGFEEVDLIGARIGYVIKARLPADQSEFDIAVSDVVAPVRGQPWHDESIAALNALVRGRRALIHPKEFLPVLEGWPVTVIARVYVDGRDLAWELVKSGNVWVWDEKSSDAELKRLQGWAREHRKGLWALPESDREPPWEFMQRRMQEIEKARAMQAPAEN